VRKYFLEAAKFCQLDVNSLLIGTGRLSRVLQKDNVQEQSTSRAISPSTEQDLARSTSPDAVPNDAASNGAAQNDSALVDATSGYQASPSAPPGDAWIGNMLVANTTAPSAEIPNQRARANRGTSIPGNAVVCSLRNVLEARAEPARGRSDGIEVDESPPQGKDRIVPLATSEDEHIHSTATSRPSRQPGHRQNQPFQPSPRENCTTRTQVATSCLQPDAEVMRQHRTTVSRTPVTEHHCFGRLDTVPTLLNKQFGVMSPDIVSHRNPQELPSVLEAMEQPEVVVPLSTPLPAPLPLTWGFRFMDTQSLQPWWQSEVRLPQQQGTADHLSDVNNLVHTAPTSAGGTVLQSRVAEHPASYTFDSPGCSPGYQHYRAIDAGGATMDGIAYTFPDDQYDPQYWNASFVL
jgi:hypothetical protein